MKFLSFVAGSQADDRWRKTVDGWEYRPEWLAEQATWLEACGQFPPVCLGLLMVLLSVAALLVTSKRVASPNSGSFLA